MVNRTRELAARDMPTAEEFALWGARELSFEELLAVNGGRHVIDDPRTDNVSDTIANGGHSPGGSSSSSDESSSDSGDSHGSDSDTSSSGIHAGSSSDTPHDSGVPNAGEQTSPTQGGGVPSVPPVQNESDITQQAANVQSSVPQVPATAEEGEKKGIKAPMNKIADTFFKNDGATTIYTTGFSASGTVTIVSGAVGGGFYVNPKNDKLFCLSTGLLGSVNPVVRTIGAILVAVNIEDIGGYAGAEAGAGVGVSGSLAMTAGSFKSKEDMAGPYCARGGSGGAGGLSGGGDMIFNMDGECIGALASFGASVDLTRFEGHTRWGVTGVTSFMKKTVTAP